MNDYTYYDVLLRTLGNKVANEAILEYIGLPYHSLNEIAKHIMTEDNVLTEEDLLQEVK